MKTFLWAAIGLLFSAGAAMACPNYEFSGSTYKFTGSDLYSAKHFGIQAGGDRNILNCPQVRPRTDRGRGFVTVSPDFTFYVSGMARYSLVMSVQSECDSILLINTGAANWYFDDDDNGNFDARISLTRPSDGWLDVWVGTHDGRICDAVLSLETFDR